MKATVSSSSICSTLRSLIGAIFVYSETIIYFVRLKRSLIEPIFVMSETIINLMRLKRGKNAPSSNSAYDSYHLQYVLIAIYAVWRIRNRGTKINVISDTL